MAHKLTTPAAVAAMLVAMLAPARAADYVQAPGSSLAFATKYDGEMFTGRFGGFDTRLSFDPERLDDARLDVTIELAGTRTGNADRDSTLLGADFFNSLPGRLQSRLFDDNWDRKYAHGMPVDPDGWEEAT